MGNHVDDLSMKTLAFHATKGGVGKSFLSLSIAHGLQRAGLRVLAIDADQQGSLTHLFLGHQSKIGLANLLVGDVNADECILPTTATWGGVHLISGGADLVAAGKLITELPGRDLILVNALKAIHDRYDVVIIDCPPSRDVVTFNAIAAANRVYTPCTPTSLDTMGIVLTLDVVEKMVRNLGLNVTMGGIILNRWGRDKLAKDIAKSLIGQFGPLVCQSVIPDTVKARESLCERVPVGAHAPGSPIAIAIESLTKEVLNHGRLEKCA